MPLLRPRDSSGPLPALPAEACPAKTAASRGPGISVLEHCRVVGHVAATLVERLPAHVRSALPAHLATLAASHDAGKVSPGFLKKHFQQWLLGACPSVACRPSHEFEDRHAIVSEAALLAWAQRHGCDADWQRWSQALGAHHGAREIPIREPCAMYGGANWLVERVTLIDALASEFGPMPLSAPSTTDLLMAAGLTCVADWVGSNEDWFPAGAAPAADQLPLRACAALDAAGLTAPEVRTGLGFGDLFPGYEPNDMQRALQELAGERGLFVVEAPMGTGKTEAALHAAYRLIADGRNQGLYFALPTRLTSNRVHERIGGFLQRGFGCQAAARLVHGQAWLTERSAGGEELQPGGSWFAPLKRALLAPFGVGTIDQAILAVLNVRHAFVRSFGLAGKVVVLDEVHSYDAYTGTLLKLLIQQLLAMHCSVIVLSATLTRARRGELVGVAPAGPEAYPLLTARTGGGLRTARTAPGASRRVVCHYVAPDERQLAEKVADTAEAGQQVLWVSNTVARSQSAWRAVRAAVRDGVPVGLLHSRFPVWRRDELEAEWMERLGKSGDRRGGSVLVATQIVEQSVDIDADFLGTDLALTDLLLQRMGRLWRHHRPQRSGTAECMIAGEALEAAGDADDARRLLGPSRWVYAPYVLWRSYRVWRQRAAVYIPDDIRLLLEATYDEDAPGDPQWTRALLEELRKRSQWLASRAVGMTRADLPTQPDDEEAAPTRWSDCPMVQVLLVRECDAVGRAARLVLSCGTAVRVSADERNLDTAKAVHRNLVSLPRHPEFRDVNRAPPYLASCVYGAVVVLRTDAAGGLHRQDKVPVPYAYDDWTGVRRVPVDSGGRGAAELEDIHESDW